jgi:hypothetical protein
MADLEILEQRLASLEKAVADLQKRVSAAPIQADWLEKVIGSISDQPAFLEALEHARALRQEDCLPDEPGTQP